MFYKICCKIKFFCYKFILFQAITKSLFNFTVDSDNVKPPANDAEIICSKTLQNSNNCLQNNNSNNDNDDDVIETITNESDVTLKCSPETQNEIQTNNETLANEITNEPATTTTTNDTSSETIISNKTTTETAATQSESNANGSSNNTNNNGKPKSCLSRHNSTHTSIKKRVNISVHTEIIEPDPLLPILVAATNNSNSTPSVGDDEDDVFSDSVPPPKRESMCAPYLERDVDYDDVVTETLAYAHGLPEWFNDERINDV